MFFQEEVTALRSPRQGSEWALPAHEVSFHQEALQIVSSLDGDASHPPSDARDSAGQTKRTSLFTMRPKSSSTTSSSSGSVHSRASSGLAGSTYSRYHSPTQDRTAPSDEGDGARSRFMFGRGRRPKDSSIRAKSPSSQDADDESDRRGSDRVRERQKSDASSDSIDIDYRISAPFGFQHIAKFERTRHPQRESARSQVLRKPLPPQAEPSEELARRLALRNQQPQKSPPPLRPKRPDELLPWQITGFPAPLPSERLSLRPMRSAEAYSRSYGPQSATMSSQASFPLQRTPRTPTRPRRSTPPSPAYIGGLQPNFPSQPPEASRPLVEETGRDEPSLYQPQEAKVCADPPMLSPLHLDTLVSPLSPSIFSPPLARVLEEPESLPSRRQSRIMDPKVSVRRSKSSPSISRMSQLLSQSVAEAPIPPPVPARPVSQGSDTLGDLDDSSVGLRLLDFLADGDDADEDLPSPKDTVAASWDEVIDYCYEHNAEANCEFDWSTTSRFDSATPEDDPKPLPWEHKKRVSRPWGHYSISSMSSGEAERFASQSRGSVRSSNLPAPESVPDLDRRSAHSVSTNSIGAMTPADKRSLQSLGGLEITIDAPEATLTEPFSSDDITFDEVLGEYHDFLIEAKSLPVGVRPKSKLRQDTQKPRLPPLPTLLPMPEKALPEAPALRKMSAPEHQHHGLRLDSIVARLRSPSSPAKPTTSRQEEREGRDSSIRSRYRSRSRQRKTVGAIPTEPVPQLPDRTASHTSILTAFKMPAVTRKPPTPPSTPGSGSGSGSGSSPSSLTPHPGTLVTHPTSAFIPPAVPPSRRLPSLDTSGRGRSPPADLDRSLPPTPRSPLLDVLQLEQTLPPASAAAGPQPSHFSAGNTFSPRRAPPPLPPPPPPPLKDAKHRAKGSQHQQQQQQHGTRHASIAVPAPRSVPEPIVGMDALVMGIQGGSPPRRTRHQSYSLFPRGEKVGTLGKVATA